jgi:hypothetical protein
MPTVTCDCGRQFPIRDEELGQTVTCPRCDQLLLVAVPGGDAIASGRRAGRCRSTQLVAAPLAAVAGPAKSRPRQSQWLQRVLVGLLVVWLLIVAWLVVSYSLFPENERGKIDRAKAQMKVIDSAINLYLVKNGVPPQCLEDLLRPDPANGGAPYLKDVRAITDPWDNLFLYEPNDPQRPTIAFKTSGGQIFTNKAGPGF